MNQPDASQDVILDRIPEGVDPRKHISLAVKVAVLLRMLNLKPEDINWDHRPPLWARKWNATRQDTVPAASDPEYINALAAAPHDRLTNGIGGERRVTSAGSDTHARAKCARLDAETKAYRAALLAKSTGETPPVTEKRKVAIPCRPKKPRRQQHRATSPVEKLAIPYPRNR